MGRKIKKLQLSKFFSWKQKYFPWLSIYHAPGEGSTISLQRSSTNGTPLESSRLADLKYSFLSRTGRKTKKLQRSNLFHWQSLSMGFKGDRHFYFNIATRAVHCWKALDLLSKNMQFQQDRGLRSKVNSFQKGKILRETPIARRA